MSGSSKNGCNAKPVIRGHGTCGLMLVESSIGQGTTEELVRYNAHLFAYVPVDNRPCREQRPVHGGHRSTMRRTHSRTCSVMRTTATSPSSFGGNPAPKGYLSAAAIQAATRARDFFVTHSPSGVSCAGTHPMNLAKVSPKPVNLPPGPEKRPWDIRLPRCHFPFFFSA
jgi:hypothetical protein